MMDFYLDDYDLVTVSKNEKLLKAGLKVFINDEDVSYVLDNDEKHLFIRLDKEYEDRDEIKIHIDEEVYEVLPRFITHKKRFDEEYKTDLTALGSFVEKDGVLFRLWAPLSKKAFVVLKDKEVEMGYLSKGLYETKIEDVSEKDAYHYKVIREKGYEFTDPFSYIDKDRKDSYVIDPKKLEKERVIPVPFKDPSVYELSVRDFSSDPSVNFKHPKKFLGLIEEGLRLDGRPVGFDYIKELGFTHYQILPVFSFDLDKADYNWGYNPLTFNSPEKSYLVSEDPYEGLGELREVVDVFHRNDMRVVLDVVYNHVYRQPDFNLERILPYYFFRYKGEKVGNASLCGNETRSESYFLREYLKLLTKRFIKTFDIDGLRFDIMGILDKKTMNEIYEGCTELKKDFIIYGEGWNMGDILPVKEKAIIENAKEMKHIGFFQGDFRGVLRGRDITDEMGYIFGDTTKTTEVMDLLQGSADLGLDKDQSVNYTECHDNYTVYDKTLKIVEEEMHRRKICKLALALTVLSRGIPFIHSGQEFLRTKKGIDNSYNSGDQINMMDWQRKNGHEDICDYLKDLLRLRKSIEALTDDGARMEFKRYYEMLICKIDDLCIFINPCIFDHIYTDDKHYDIVFDENGFKKRSGDGVDIPCFSVVAAFQR